MKSLTTAALTTVLALGTALAPSSAGAATQRDRDAVGDVYAYTASPDGIATPTRTDGDIWASKVRYRPRTLTITMRLVTLTRTVDRWSAAYRVKNGKGVIRRIDLSTVPGERVRVKMARLTGAGDYEAITCAVARHVDYADDFIRISVPARCLGNPRVVRVGLGLTGTTSTGNYIDDGHVDGSGTDEDLVFGAPVRRG